jgi:ATP-dependent DNA helicase DinG
MISLNEDQGEEKPVSRAPALVASIFSDSGWLSEALSLEHRPEQEHMAKAIASVLKSDHSLLFEAGTGVGKSMAYLVPGIIQAMDQNRQMLVSTHTISLQEQLESKDLPLCRRLFTAIPELKVYADFKSAVLLGKSNYLCTTRLSHALAEKAGLFSDDEYEELQRIAAWSETTEHGLRHELRPAPIAEVWDSVNSDSSTCSRRHCEGSACFYHKARGRLKAAHVIILNHALLFSLIKSGGAKSEGATHEEKGILFPEDFLVLDEAHTIPEVATDHFGLSLSSYGIERSLKILYNPKTKRGLLKKRGESEVARRVTDVIEASKQFFSRVDEKLLSVRPIVRSREPEAIETTLDGPLDTLHTLVGKIADSLEDGRERDELLEHKSRLKGIQASISDWLSLADKTHVYWAERAGRNQTTVVLRSAPIDVAPELRRHLFGCGVSVICTSATLAIAGEIDPFALRIGAESAKTLMVKSPFDYHQNMRVFVASDVPLPSTQGARLSLQVLADYIFFCTQKVKGGTLVLFTSHSDLRAVVADLEPKFSAAGRTLLSQGDSASRTELARQMRTLGNAVLFGTDSFWTGVDVPGDALSQVIITRLPFDPPDHPIIEARSDRLKEEGLNPFNELTLPDALVKFRQGVGRLIRSKTDRGLITILDSRLLAKTYGRMFIECLPNTEFQKITKESREALFRAYL